MEREANRHRGCVLIVDDHELSRRHTALALRRFTCAVKEADCGLRGIRCALRNAPKLVFLDRHLPDMDGLRVPAKIADRWPWNLALPVFVLLTGDSTTVRPSQPGSNGLSHILAKPASVREIRRVATRYLATLPGVRDGTDSAVMPMTRATMLRLFRDDVNRMIPAIDGHILDLDWQGARRLLHQLIASSAICEEREIERCCRTLYCLLPPEHGLADVANAWAGVLRSISRSGHRVQAW